MKRGTTSLSTVSTLSTGEQNSIVRFPSPSPLCLACDSPSRDSQLRHHIEGAILNVETLF